MLNIFFALALMFVDICILVFIYMDAKLFGMTKHMKKVIKKARLAGKILFYIIAFFLMLVEFIPNIVAIIIVAIIAFFEYLADKDKTFKTCFVSHFKG